MRALAIVCLLVACARPSTPHDVPRPALSYAVALDDSLEHMRVELCPRAARLPDALVPIHRAALDHLTSIAIVDDEGVVRTIAPSTRVDLSDAPARACVRYDVDLTRCAEPHGPPSCARAGRDLFAPTSTWLLAPETRVLAARYALRFALPEDVSASPMGADEMEPNVLELDDRAFAYVSYVAFTHTRSRPLAVAGACMDVVTLDGSISATEADRDRWLSSAARAATRVTGAAPAGRLTAIVVPTLDVPSMPVVFGVAGRGMQPTITLFVGAHSEADALVRDWTAVHELAHLLVADLDDDDVWLGEGLATYYEEIARAREGLLTETEAWSSLLNGWRRGRASCTGEDTLRERSRTMRQTHAYGCVYWSGAALALIVDVAYRRAGSSLDDAIARAWPHRAEHASADELVGWLDGAPSGMFAVLAGRALDATAFPDVESALRWLGVEAIDDGVVLHDDAPGADARRAMMNGAPPAASNPSSCE